MPPRDSVAQVGTAHRAVRSRTDILTSLDLGAECAADLKPKRTRSERQIHSCHDLQRVEHGKGFVKIHLADRQRYRQSPSDNYL